MGEMREMGKALLVIGGVVVFFGLILLFGDKVPFFGRLPGDITLKKGNFTLLFPITSMILISAILSLIVMTVRK